MSKITKIALYSLFTLFALFGLLTTTASAQDAATETITYTFERTEVPGEGWYFIQTTRRPDSSIVVNTLQTYRATEAEIDSFITAYKRGLDHDLLRTEAAFNDAKAKKEAAAPVGPAVIFFRTAKPGEFTILNSAIKPHLVTLPDSTIKPQAGSIWQYDGTGYVPYVCPAPKKKAPAKTTKTTKPKK